MQLTAQEVKRQASALGADAVGIADMDRFEGAPLQMDPRQIMPEARSLVAMAFRVMRGSLRGVEEGTFFSNYSSMGYGGLTYLYMPLTVINLCKFIEDRGAEAIPIGHQSDWRAIDNVGAMKPGFSRPVEPGRAAPDVMVHLRIAAYLAGLGEIGWSKVLLTPQFGPRQRIGIVLTEAELEPDPIYDGPKLCNRCMACVRSCPGGAISETEAVTVRLAGREVQWGRLDEGACDLAFVGARRSADGEAGSEYVPGRPDTSPSRISPFRKKPSNLYNSGQAVCGGAGCVRACMISLEKRGALSNRFEREFRRRKPWSVDWSAGDPDVPAAAAGSEPD
jgi:epoxyqueuosine reductase